MSPKEHDPHKSPPHVPEVLIGGAAAVTATGLFIAIHRKVASRRQNQYAEIVAEASESPQSELDIPATQDSTDS